MLASPREAVHRACPEAEEAIKWGMPTFLYRGKILCGLAAFKQHMSFGFWQHEQVMGRDAERGGMGSYGKLREASYLPKAATLKADIRKAMKLIDEAAAGKVAAKQTRSGRPVPDVPEDFAAALAKARKVRSHFDGFPPSRKREYIEWITDAKREDARSRRIAQAVEWLAEGKRRNWKHENCWFDAASDSLRRAVQPDHWIAAGVGIPGTMPAVEEIQPPPG